MIGSMVGACAPSGALDKLHGQMTPDAGTPAGGSGGAANDAGDTGKGTAEPDDTSGEGGGSGAEGGVGANGGTGGSSTGGSGGSDDSEPDDAGGAGGDDPGDAGMMAAGSDPSDAGAGGDTRGGSSSDGGQAGGGSGGDGASGGSESGGSGGDGASGGSGGSGMIDECPNDDDKTEPGLCDCGTPDTDGDSDGTPDCDDECPDDEDKTEPGDCGCGEAENPACAVLLNSLVHRYDFNGSDSVVEDVVGSADGTVIGGSQSGGRVQLAGGNTDQHVNLPNGIISGLTDATIEAWVTWSATANWSRIFDFGSSTGDEGAQGDGVTYLYLTPRGVNDSGFLSVGISENGLVDETRLPGTFALNTGVEYHVAVTVADGDTLALYADGELEAFTELSVSLKDLDDVNNWLGRSQFDVDPEFNGSIHEFRIYDAALTPVEIEFSYDLGANPELFDQ